MIVVIVPENDSVQQKLEVWDSDMELLFVLVCDIRAVMDALCVSVYVGVGERLGLEDGVAKGVHVSDADGEIVKLCVGELDGEADMVGVGVCDGVFVCDQTTV